MAIDVQCNMTGDVTPYNDALSGMKLSTCQYMGKHGSE